MKEDFQAVRQTVDDVIEAMWQTDERDHLFVRQGWPGASCENVGVAVAAVLEDRGLGQWTFVTASRPGEVNGHAWLEYRGADDEVLFSIDPTLHQFEEWPEPFIGPGRTPAAYVFTERTYEGLIWEWPWLGGSHQIFRRLLQAVRDELGR